MKKILFTGLMLAACCMGANAQNVQEDGAIITEDFVSTTSLPIPPEYTKEGESLLAVLYGYDSDYPEKLRIYNDNLEQIYEFTPEQAAITNYRITREREPEVHEAGYVTYTGDWIEEKEEDPTYYSMEILVINDHNGTWDGNSSIVTQTLFNDDEAYEYVIPIIAYTRNSRAENDRDGDGEIDYIQEVYRHANVGFNIKSSNGQTLQSIKLESGHEYDDIELIKFNKKTYLCLLAYPSEGDGDRYSIYYPIKPNSTGINPLGAPVRMKVSPRMADRSESFTVELDGESSAEREVVVVNSAGQTVWKQKVPAGQRTVSIGAARLGKGVNVVRVNGGKGAESCKVIVK